MRCRKLRVMYVGDVAPADTTSGAKLLYRHLRLAAEHHAVETVHFDDSIVPGCGHTRLRPRRLASWALASRRRRHFAAMDACWGVRAADDTVAAAAGRFRPDVLLTVAQGGLCFNAVRVGRRLGLPVATIFHDWSPDWRQHPAWSQKPMERAFRRLYRESRAALCISEALRDELGEHAHATVLPPIPDPFLPVPTPAAATHEVIYAGMLNGLVEPEVRALAEACLACKDSPVTFYGPRPYWGDGLDERLLRHGCYRGYQPLAEIDPRLAAAGALLVIMPFGAAGRRFAEFSFPSKLAEYTRYGRPIVVWGPEYCSAARWAKATGGAAVVSDPSPLALLRALERVIHVDGEAETLAHAARAAFADQFSPARLQQEFEQALARAVDVP